VLTKFEFSKSSGVSVKSDNRVTYRCCHLSLCNNKQRLPATVSPTSKWKTHA